MADSDGFEKDEDVYVSRITLISEQRINVVSLADSVERFGIVTNVSSEKRHTWGAEW